MKFTTTELATFAECDLTLIIHGNRFPFKLANEASAILSAQREQASLDGWGGSREFGTQFEIVDRKGREVGYVSYNGRVWQGTRRNWEQAVCVYPLELAGVRS